MIAYDHLDKHRISIVTNPSKIAQISYTSLLK